MKKWEITYFSQGVFNEVMRLPKKLKARFYALSERMQEIGPNLGLPHSKSMGKGLFEMRVKAQEGIARVFYCACINNELVILHVFVKKTQATPKKELQIAQKRLKEVKDNE